MTTWLRDQVHCQEACQLALVTVLLPVKPRQRIWYRQQCYSVQNSRKPNAGPSISVRSRILLAVLSQNPLRLWGLAEVPVPLLANCSSEQPGKEYGLSLILQKAWSHNLTWERFCKFWGPKPLGSLRTEGQRRLRTGMGASRASGDSLQQMNMTRHTCVSRAKFMNQDTWVVLE